jgi:hypothetical protein
MRVVRLAFLLGPLPTADLAREAAMRRLRQALEAILARAIGCAAKS